MIFIAFIRSVTARPGHNSFNAIEGERLERIPITRKGYEALKAELERIKKVDRPANIIAIEEARAHGDLSENAEYDAAKERQQFINGRISELGYKLGNADIIDPRPVKMSSINWSAPMNPTSTKGASRSPHRSARPSSESVRTTKLRCRLPVASAYTSWWKFCDADLLKQ